MPFETYLEEVTRARQDGFAIDRGTYVKGVTTVSAPVLAERRPILAISAVGFSAQFSPASLRQLADDVRDCARAASDTLSGAPASAASGP